MMKVFLYCFYKLTIEKIKKEEEDAKKAFDKKIKGRTSYTSTGLQKNSVGEGNRQKGSFNTFTENEGKIPWKLWWEMKKERNNQILMACEKGDTFIVKELLDATLYGDLIADVNVKGLDEFTPLHHAVNEGFVKIVEILLGANPIVDSLSTSLRTPLHIACFRGSSEIIDLLLKAGANINAQEMDGNTPVHILSESGNHEALAVLLKYKPNMSIKNNFGDTPDEVASNIEIRNLIIQNGKPGESDKSGYNRTIMDNILLHNNRADMIKLLMFKGQMLNAQSQPPDKKKEQTKELKEENKIKHQNQRRIKIIEAAMKMNDTPDSPLKDKKALEETIRPEDFIYLQKLGQGSFGEVYLVQYKASPKLYAMKILNKKRVMTQNLLKYATTERNVLCYTKHPFIVGLNFAFQTSEKLFLILDYCPGYI